MKHRKWLAGVCLLVSAAFAGAAQEIQAPKVVPIKSNATFDRMKALAGDWEGSNGRGLPARLNYRVSSGGTVLLETLTSREPGGKDIEMLTAYHLDGDKLMMTHY